jgi:hypothetical protein
MYHEIQVETPEIKKSQRFLLLFNSQQEQWNIEYELSGEY